MSALLPDYSNEDLQRLVTAFLKDALKIDRSPKEIQISEYVILVVLGESIGAGMKLDDDYNFVYDVDTQGRIAIINFTNPEILHEFAKQHPLPPVN